VHQVGNQYVVRPTKVHDITYLVTHFYGILHIKTYSTVMLRVVLHGFETLTATLPKRT